MAKKEINTITSLEDCYNELKKDSVELKTKYNFTYKRKTIYTQLGRIWFNLLLPENFSRFVDEPVNGKLLESICFEILQNNPPEVAAEYIDKIQHEAYKLNTINPISFTNHSFILSEKLKKEKKEQITDDLKPEEYNTVITKLAKEFLENTKDEQLKSLVGSKATGKLNEAALAIWLFGKGPVLDVENKISKPIKSSLTDGYNAEEYYLAASEARRGNYIRGVGTSDPGTLARHVAFALANVKITKKDCKSKKYLNIFVTKDKFKLLQERYFLNEKTNKLEQITLEHTHLINTMIKLRSPIYCKDPNGICPICFGKSETELGTNKIGLLTAAIMNDIGVQGYSMKARHAASSVSLQKCDFTMDLIEV